MIHRFPARLLLLTLLLTLLGTPTLAADPPLPPGTPLIGEAALSQTGVASNFARATPAEPPAADLGPALRVQMTGHGYQPWSAVLQYTVPKAVEAGELIHVRFYLRNVASMTGNALVSAQFEENRPDWHKAMRFSATAGPEWQRFDIPFRADRDFPAGGAQVSFYFGYADQTVEIGGIEVITYRDTDVTLDQLPRTRMKYEGIEPDAPWRAEAEARIDEHRKADLVIEVVDAEGNPVPDARVQVRQTEHAFQFGTAIAAEYLLAEGGDGERYRQTLEKHFNSIVFENDLKWPLLENPHWGFDRPRRAIDWLVERDFSVGGHVLVWPGTKFLPKDVVSLADRPEALRQRVRDHVRQTVEAFEPGIDEWDVLNEPTVNTFLMDILGREEMAEWFRIAHEADPDCRLFINDYSILASLDRVGTEHQDTYYQTIRFLLDEGAPVHAIGLQSHFTPPFTRPEYLLQILDRFAQFGLPIQITELDIQIDDPPLQARYLEDFCTAVFSHPAVVGIFHWGFWEGRHWRPDAALWDRGWALRPHGKVWQDLIFSRWQTRESVTTNEAGIAEVRGFHGEYRVTVIHGQSRREDTLQLTSDGLHAQLKLDGP
jgi:GH35 family endo-1,4-beta-xylanase